MEETMFGLDRIVIYIIGAALLLLAVFGGYQYWKYTVKREALAEWNRQQIEIVQKAQQEYIQKTEELKKEQKKIVNDLAKQRRDLDRKFDSLEKYLDSPKTVKHYRDRKSSEVLKRTFKELGR
jgi:uncharacterized protein YoxC